MAETKLSGFEMIEKIGEGGMAVVWKARQISLDRIVAIKFLPERISQRVEEVQRLQAEARAAARLKHPGIVQVYDASQESGSFYFVMEYIAGYTLSTWIRRKGILSEENALLVTEYIGDALNYAWKTAGIIHCDIKPDNIMVDSDGTIKVADLGLARIRETSKRRAEVEEIMGTPSYMSPEQGKGEHDLDCRTDIYSLGATLYQMVTGRRPFEGTPETQIIDKQITDQIPDPLELNPNLSFGAALLIEKMMAKDRGLRHADWDAVLSDIKQVKNRRLPLNWLPPEGSSTVRCSPQRADQMRLAASSYQIGKQYDEVKNRARSRLMKDRELPERSGLPMVWMGLGLALLLLAVIIIVVTSREKAQQRIVSPEPAPPTPGPRVPGGTQTTVAPERAEEFFQYAVNWCDNHPTAYDEAITRFKRVANVSKGTKFQQMAEEEIRRIEKLKLQEIDATLARLAEQAKPLIAQGKLWEAADIYDKYSGPLAGEMFAERFKRANELKQKAKALEQAKLEAIQKAELRMTNLAQAVSSSVIAGDVLAAHRAVAEAIGSGEVPDRKDMLEAALNVLAGATNMDQRIMESFRKQIGQNVTVALEKETRTLRVTSVKANRIFGEQDVGGGFGGVDFHVAKLSAKEKRQRLGPDEDPSSALLRGVVDCQAKAYSRAKDCFAKAGPFLSEILVAGVTDMETRGKEEKAEQELADLMKAIGVDVGPFNEVDWGAAVESRVFTTEQLQAARKQIAKFLSTYGDTAAAKKADPILKILLQGEEVAVSPPDTRPPDVSPPQVPFTGDPAEAKRLAEKVRDEILMRNMGVVEDEVQFTQDPDGAVRFMAVNSPMVTDVGPLRALKTLGRVSLMAFEGRSKLEDLSPLRELPNLTNLCFNSASVRDFSFLRGMKLRVLEMPQTQIKDLMILREVPIEEVRLTGTPIRDLTPVRSLPLLRSLDVENTKVFSILPLAGTQLRRLNLAGTQIKEISSLKGIPLADLNVSRTGVHDFAPVKGMPLRAFSASDTQIRDLAVLENAKLVALELSGARNVADISVLKGMPLEYLFLNGTLVKDISVLEGMRLRCLGLGGTRVKDISVVKGMPLTYLNLAGSGVWDLSPLAGMKLERLDLTGTEVRNLSVLHRMPLRELRIQGIKAKDFEPLKGLEVQAISLDNPETVQHILRTMPKLRYVNGLDIRGPGPRGR